MIITVSIIPVFAQNSESMTININKETYTQGDTIIVFGQVNKMISGLPDISIQIYNAGNLVFVAQPQLANDGTYAESIFASGNLWKTNGTYLVRVFYTEEIVTETIFNFIIQNKLLILYQPFLSIFLTHLKFLMLAML